MRGKVIWIDSNNSERIKIELASERRAILDLSGDEVEINDILEGNFTNLGDEKLTNITQNKEIYVYIQDFD